MTTYSVTLPITGYVVVEVEADDEKSAIQAALEGQMGMDDAEEPVANRALEGGYPSCGQCSNQTAKRLVGGEGRSARSALSPAPPAARCIAG